MTGGIVTLLALLGFLAVVIYVFVIKRREDFDEQARQPLEDRDERRKHGHGEGRSDRDDHGGTSKDGEKQS
jgi:cbb3-type cytochrome oxidase subunit 3